MKIFDFKSGEEDPILYQVSSTFCEKSLIRQIIGYLLALIGGGMLTDELLSGQSLFSGARYPYLINSVTCHNSSFFTFCHWTELINI